MTGDEIARLAYLALLGTAVIGWGIAESRGGLGPMLKRLLVWGFIFLGVVGGYGLWEDIQNDVAPRQLVQNAGARIEVPRSFDGHYYLTLEVNGRDIEFVVDTGATDIVLADEDARRLGIDTDALSFSGLANTANGTVRTARVALDRVSLGGLTERNVPAVVNNGEMDGSLLGMRYLQRFSRLEISDNTLVLER
ncbi:MAG: TIGR02281 family clan AA aspartic protease [Pseudomonadota bacterium]